AVCADHRQSDGQAGVFGRRSRRVPPSTAPPPAVPAGSKIIEASAVDRRRIIFLWCQCRWHEFLLFAASAAVWVFLLGFNHRGGGFFFLFCGRTSNYTGSRRARESAPTRPCGGRPQLKIETR